MEDTKVSEKSDTKAGPIKGEHMDTPIAQDFSRESKYSKE